MKLNDTLTSGDGIAWRVVGFSDEPDTGLATIEEYRFGSAAYRFMIPVNLWDLIAQHQQADRPTEICEDCGHQWNTDESIRCPLCGGLPESLETTPEEDDPR